MITAFKMTTITSSLSKPPVFRRVDLDQLTIRFVTPYFADLKPRVLRDEHGIVKLDGQGQEIPVMHRSPADSYSIPYGDVSGIQVPDLGHADTYEQLRHAIETDLGVNLTLDQLTLAWKNPCDYWAIHDRMCAFRSGEELGHVVEHLRQIQLVRPTTGESPVFLYLVRQSKVGDQVELTIIRYTANMS